jgi:hypothetical protein
MFSLDATSVRLHILTKLLGATAASVADQRRCLLVHESSFTLLTIVPRLDNRATESRLNMFELRFYRLFKKSEVSLSVISRNGIKVSGHFTNKDGTFSDGPGPNDIFPFNAKIRFPLPLWATHSDFSDCFKHVCSVSTILPKSCGFNRQHRSKLAIVKSGEYRGGLQQGSR